MSLQGKVVLITGGSQGIGKACVERVARDGASVVINYNRSADSANALVQSIGSDRALAVQANVGKLDDLDKLVKAAVDKFGRIDVVMLNAGIMHMADLAATTPEAYDEMMDVLVKGPYFLVQKVVPHMPKGGRVVFVSTGVAHLSGVAPNYLLYATAKGAVEQMTRVMAKDLGRKGILVNAMAPGPTATELFFKGKPESLLTTMKGMNPFGRFAEPEEMAGTFAFLCGPDSTWVCGQILQVNGATMV